MGQKMGMCTMRDSLYRLMQEEKISEDLVRELIMNTEDDESPNKGNAQRKQSQQPESF